MRELIDVAASVLELVAPGEDLEVYGVHTVTNTVQAGDRATITRVEHAETRGLGIRVFTDDRVGYASTADLRPDVLRGSVARARANAEASDRDPESRPPAAQPDSGPLPVLPLPAVSSWTLENKVALITELVRAVEDLDPRVDRVDTAEYLDERREVAVVSTRGVRTHQVLHWCELWVDALGDHPAGRAVDTGYWSGTDPAEVDPAAMAREAVERTTRLLGKGQDRPEGLPVLLDYAVVAELLGVVGRACSGGALSTGRSPFADLFGQPVGSEVVNLADDGTRAAGIYDNKGTPRRRTDLIVSGILTGALHSAATASAMGDDSTSTGNARRLTYKSAPRAAAAGLLLEPTTGYRRMVADVQNAVYVQQLTGAGSGINAVTGRIDVGGVGWLLRDGQAAGPVATVSLATDVVSLLRSVTAVADDARRLSDPAVVATTVACDAGLLR